MRVKPSTDEPSNQVPCLMAFGIMWIGICTLFVMPCRSTNCSCTVRMPAFSALATVASAALVSASVRAPYPFDMIPLHRAVPESCAYGTDFTPCKPGEKPSEGEYGLSERPGCGLEGG